MSVQFLVRAIGVTVGPATALNHDGSKFTFEDLPDGSLLAVDRDGNLYISRGTALHADSYLDRSCWPNANATGTISLYRDHWRVLLLVADAKETDTGRKLAPASRAVLDARVQVIHHKLLPLMSMCTVREFMLRDKVA